MLEHAVRALVVGHRLGPARGGSWVRSRNGVARGEPGRAWGDAAKCAGSRSRRLRSVIHGQPTFSTSPLLSITTGSHSPIALAPTSRFASSQ